LKSKKGRGERRKFIYLLQNFIALRIFVDKTVLVAPEGSMLGTGSHNNLNQSFSFSFPATKDGLKGFLKGIG